MAWTTATPTPAQAAKADRFVALVESKRRDVETALNAGQSAKRCQAWIDANGYGSILPRTWNGAADEEKFTTIARRATLLERYRTGLIGGSLGMRDTPAIAGDLSIVGPMPAPEGAPPVYSLGVIPLLAIVVVGGIVLLAAAITTAIGFYSDTRAEEEQTKRKIADLDAAAAKAGGSVAANWTAFKQANADADGGILGALKGGIGSLVLVALILGGVYVAGKALERKGAAA